jgi:transcription elongation GreA/GreB family factor
MFILLKFINWVENETNPDGGAVLPDARGSACGTSDGDLSGRRANRQHVAMSRAFVKEGDGAEGEPLAELQVSPHRNLVTAEGLAQIEAQVERLRGELSAARSVDDRAARQRIQRDLRYWNERQRTAERVPQVAADGKARFGSTVTLEKAGGSRVAYHIVGEDEANPAEGKISYVSPLARGLIGKEIRDVVTLRDEDAEIVDIS